MDETKRVAVQRWLMKASNDLRTAETMLLADPPTTDTVCFHAQQCVEKCLKAFLTYADRHVERMHYLTRLVELCSQVDGSFQELRTLAVQLTDYAVADRYPDNWREIPVEEAEAAVKSAVQAMAFVRSKLGVSGVDSWSLFE